jgi:hypothetical protein
MAFPILAGLAMGALMGGGIAALQKKDILQGALMGGVGGALGGAFMPAAGGIAGTAAESSLAGTLAGEAGAQGLGSAFSSGAANPLLVESGTSGLAGAAMEGGALGVNQGIMTGATQPAAASTGLFGGSGGIGNFLSQNKYALAGGALGGMMAPGKEPEPAEQGNIRDYTFSQERNPLFGQPGQAAFTNQQFTPGAVTPVEDYNKANGGIIALAEGGQPGMEMQRYERPVRQMAPEVAAYNAQLMERANQQYNINPRPAPNQVPGSAGYIAPPAPKAPAAAAGVSSDSISGLTFNPVTQQFEGTFSAPGSDKKRFGGTYDDTDYAELDARYGRPVEETSTGKNGGLMSSYADGGGISSLGSYSDGGQLLKGPGDGVSDSIPAQIGARQPARLADGEFVIPARIVSELGNGSTDAGAKQLYAMMDRVQKARNKTVGKNKVAVDAKARKLLPA